MQSPSIPNNSVPDSGSGAWTISRVLQWTTSYFNKQGIDNGRVDAEILLAHALGRSRIDLYLSHDQPLESNELEKFKELIKRRAAREPVAFIIGRKEFWSHTFAVSKEVLIPRPETECLVETAIEIIARSDGHGQGRVRVLELGTGSGAIVITLAGERPKNTYFATDMSLAALNIAVRNSQRILPGNKINWIVGDWLEAVKEHGGQFDLIVSNPPYICKDLIDTLQPEICRFEPSIALDGGIDGLDCYRRIIPEASRRLSPGGYLLLEIGFDQKESISQVAATCQQVGSVSFKKDYSGHDRVAVLKMRR